MARYGEKRYVTDQERRDFLKALGIAGAVGATGTGIQEMRDALATSASGELAGTGRAVRSDLTGTLDADLIASQQAAVADAVGGLSGAAERDLPTGGPREEFAPIASAARPVYDHLGEAGFFESTTRHLPEFDPAFLASAVKTFVGSEGLSQSLDDLGLTGSFGVDLLAEVISNAERLSTHHWVATDALPREQIEGGQYIPSMTAAATFGVLSWLDHLDNHLWQNRVLITDEIQSDAVWHARSMTAGFQLVSEGAKALADGSNDLSDGELSALLTTGFAVEAISQNLLPQDVYWITDEMRAPGRDDIRTITTE